MSKFLSRNRAVILSIIVIGIALLAILLPNMLTADAPPGTTQGAAASPGTSQGAAADAARWERMAQYYRARSSVEAAQRVRANEATAQRWEAMVEFYTRKAAADAQRANDAMAARWEAMAEFYAAQHK
jgi:hypothetical protein